MNFDINSTQKKSDTPLFGMDELERMNLQEFKEAVSFIENENKLVNISEYFSKLGDFQKAIHVDNLLQRIGEVRYN